MWWLPEQVTLMAKLVLQDHWKARKLWEEVFDEDTDRFLNYYDLCMADHNQIFVEKEQDELVSMLQLNPYRIRMNGKEINSYYIVAVATKEVYRHQGRMCRLLTEALSQMKQEKIPFTYLMPASEAIYQPFDFVTVYRQSMFAAGARIEKKEGDWDCIPCRKEEIPRLVAWSNQFLREHCDISSVRSEEYYERIWKEQESMNGQILLFYEKDQMRGYCFTGCEESAEAWEIAVTDSSQDKANRKAMEALTRWFADKGQLPVRICGFLPGSQMEHISMKEWSFRPMTMVRIVDLEAFTRNLRAKEEVSFVLNIKDPILPDNKGTFQFLLGSHEGRCIRTEETAAPEIGIAEFTEAIFAERRTEKIPQEKLYLPERVYLNEVV